MDNMNCQDDGNGTVDCNLPTEQEKINAALAWMVVPNTPTTDDLTADNDSRVPSMDWHGSNAAEHVTRHDTKPDYSVVKRHNRVGVFSVELGIGEHTDTEIESMVRDALATSGWEVPSVLRLYTFDLERPTDVRNDAGYVHGSARQGLTIDKPAI